jgi:hypothetical protein
VRNEKGKVGGAYSRRLSQLIPALKANLARVPSSHGVQPDLASTSSLTLAEVEASLRSRLEPLPEMMLNEVLRLRDHTRYFLVANGHVDALSPQAELMGKKQVLDLSRENTIPEEMKELLDDIAQEEGLEERLKREVWDDVHARNVSFVLPHIAISGVPHCDVVRRCLCLALRVSISRHESLYSPAWLR